jgi:hypothetical protein
MLAVNDREIHACGAEDFDNLGGSDLYERTEEEALLPQFPLRAIPFEGHFFCGFDAGFFSGNTRSSLCL